MPQNTSLEIPIGSLDARAGSPYGSPIIDPLSSRKPLYAIKNQREAIKSELVVYGIRLLA